MIAKIDNLTLGKSELECMLPSEYAEAIGVDYAKSTTALHKKNSGQFFTPKQIADFMGNLAQTKNGNVSILDPGCGSAILSCSLIEQLVAKSNIQTIKLTLFETDKDILIKTKAVVLFLKKWLAKKNIAINVVIEQMDFI